MNALATYARFPAEPESAAAARHLVEGVLRHQGLDARVVDAALLTSEVVTNAVLHAGTEVKVTIRVERDVIRVEVDDRGMGAAVLKYPDADKMRGRGLRIVDTVADRWGDEHHPGGLHRVWFELRTGDEPSPAERGRERDGEEGRAHDERG